MDYTNSSHDMNVTVDLAQDTDEMILGYRPRDITMVNSLLALLGMFGFVGNILSAVVWTKPQLKSSSAVLLTALAISDLLIVLCLNLLQYFGSIIFTYHSPKVADFKNFVWAYVIFWLLPIGYIAQTASVYLTLTIAVERYIAVCHPFEFQWTHSYSRACKSAAAAAIFSIVYNMSRFWEKEVRPVFGPGGDVTSYSYKSTSLFHNPLYQSLYMNWLYLIMNNLLPLTGIVVFNTCIYRKLNESRGGRYALSDSEKSENRLTMMLVYVVGEFLVCSSVTTFFAIAYIAIDVSGYKLNEDLMKQLVPIDEFLYTLNSSVNFVTYFTFGGPFRKEFLKSFGCCKRLVVESESQMSSVTQKINLDLKSV